MKSGGKTQKNPRQVWEDSNATCNGNVNRAVVYKTYFEFTNFQGLICSLMVEKTQLFSGALAPARGGLKRITVS